MILTFERDYPRMIRLANICALRYCKTTGKYNERDDARSDALVLIASTPISSAFCVAKQNAYLVRAVVGKMIRQSQNALGLRLKSAPSETSINIDEIASNERVDALNETLDDDELNVLRTALNQFSQRDINVINAVIVDGEKQKDVAIKFHLSQSRISQIVRRFKNIERDTVRAFCPR